MVTFEIARRLVQRGDSVEWFSATFDGAPAEETLEGVHLVREGRQWSVHWIAFQRYRGKLARDFDVVVDEVNTIPFFTPVWSDIPTVMFIHQLAREVWWYESAFPLNAVGYVAEPLYLRCYRNVPAITVSASTRDDLRNLGFKSNITIIPQGLEQISGVDAVKSTVPRILYVGRLAPSKRVADVIHAFATFCKSARDSKLCLLGDGPEGYVRQLHSLVEKLGISERVRFAGRVTTAEKHRAMAAAHLLVLASAREGWGLVVTEANAFGTPAVAYNVPGLRDSIRDQETGLLVEQTHRALAEAMIRLWRDQELYLRLAVRAKAWSGTFSFDRTAAAFRNQLAEMLAEPRPGHPDGAAVGN